MRQNKNRLHGSKTEVKQLISNMEGHAALPRKNGELVFQSPWESKTFGMAIALQENGLYDWEEFRELLIHQIKEWQSKPTASSREWNYYERWISSLEELLVKKGIITRKELAQRTREFETGLRDEGHHRH
ncbi:MAG TPA: nitrile hydratase accessory protein [Candidatus Bathyarchaeia archaeon]|nr:nitrile hydratase accessory protein [Candidatus Bathyarchaeia archaeon]